MRILTFDLDIEKSPCDIEAALQRRIDSSDRLTAARWQKMLELVRVLQEDGPYPEAL